MTYAISVILSDGKIVSRTARTMPKNWRSWIMQACPCGTDFHGATFDYIATRVVR